MATVHFTRALQRHVPCPSSTVAGDTVREVLDAYFEQHPAVRGYVLDERGVLRRHVTIFVQGTQVVDRDNLSDALGTADEVHVMQALSGGQLDVLDVLDIEEAQ
jgi:molybdopterin converting factor small subunit